MNALVLHLDGIPVPVETAGSSRKARLTVEADGSLSLRAPSDVAPDELERFLVSKRAWIYRKLSEKEALQHEPITKEMVDGEGFSYLGRSHRLQLSDDATTVRLERGGLVLPRTKADAGAEPIIEWYRRRGEAWLKPRTRSWAERLRVEPEGISVADLGRKWGAPPLTDVCGCIGRPSSSHRLWWTTSSSTSWPTSENRTTDRPSGRSSRGPCRTTTGRRKS